MNAIKQLDRILRGEATDLEALRTEQLRFSVPGMALVLNALGLVYGACMGVFAVTGSGSGAGMQVVASMVKVPALFVGTLLVTFPSLYVFNALFGSRLRFAPMLRLLLGSMAVTLAVLSSIGPIVAFFSVSSTSYAFMVLLNVVVFAAAGLFGLSFLIKTLKKLKMADWTAETERVQAARAELVQTTATPAAAPSPEAAGTHHVAGSATVDESVGESNDDTGVYVAQSAPYPPPIPSHPASSPARQPVPQYPAPPNVGAIFRVWVIIFGLVGTQMAWVLRPFIGDPHRDFTWFRPRGGNFFEAVWRQIEHFTR